jgi:uncharacterized membrane protein
MDSSSLRFRISPVDALGTAWNATFSHVGPIIGFTLLYYIAVTLFGFLPFVGPFANLFGFVLCCAMFSGYDSIHRNGALNFETLFSWTPRFGKLLGSYVIMGLIGVALFIPLIVLIMMTIGFGFFGEMTSGSSGFMITLRSISGVLLLGFFVLGMAAVVVLSVLTFALLFLVQFRDMSIGESLKLSMAVGRENVPQIIVFILLAIGIIILGALACFVGLLVAVPMVYGMQYYLLRSIFPFDEASRWDFMRDEHA